MSDVAALAGRCAAAVLLAAAASGAAAAPRAPVLRQVVVPHPYHRPPPARPRLVVVIVVDQLRPDYLDRFRPHFGAGGFDLMLARGARFLQARYQQAITSTCPGHAIVATGSYGMVNGIIANWWYDRGEGRKVYCAEDDGTKLIGARGRGRSPRRLLMETVGDALKVATAGRSRVVTISPKDRSAIMLGGHRADAAYWMVDTLFVTSSYYRSDLPAWVREFNASGAVSGYFGRRWERVLPAGAYAMMGPDDQPGEADVAGLRRTFPHPVGGIKAFEDSPFSNEVVARLAMSAVSAEDLGGDTIPDLLGIGFSANDGVGHAYGPESHEVLDVTVRLDRTLQELFGFLDRTVGLSRTLIILTADHGVAPIPEVLDRRPAAGHGGRLQPDAIERVVRRALEARYGRAARPGWVLAHQPPMVYLNRAALAAAGASVEEGQRVAGTALQGITGVREVLSATELAHRRASGTAGAPGRSYHPARSGDLYYALDRYWLVDDWTAGTNHGSGWDYDQQVPLLWYGAGVTPGVYQEPAAVTDVAPTLAALLGVPAPAGAQGRVLTSLLR